MGGGGTAVHRVQTKRTAHVLQLQIVDVEGAGGLQPLKKSAKNRGLQARPTAHTKTASMRRPFLHSVMWGRAVTG